MHVCCFPVYIISPSRKLGALSLSLYGELIDGIITVISEKKKLFGCWLPVFNRCTHIHTIRYMLPEGSDVCQF